MKRAPFQLLARSGLPRLARRLNRSKLCVLMYHGFSTNRVFPGISNHQGMHLHIDDFRRHLETLRRKNYSIVALEEVVAHFREGRPLPPYSVLITIDDGYRSNHSLAYPVLKELGAPAAVFVTTDFISTRKPLWHDRVEYALSGTRVSRLKLELVGTRLDVGLEDDRAKVEAARHIFRALKRAPQDDLDRSVSTLEEVLGVRLELDAQAPSEYQPLTWAEVTELGSSGLVTVGSHTRSHVILSRTSPERLLDEVRGSQAEIERNTGLSVRWFCYPNGGPTDFDAATRAALVEAGYKCGLTTVTGLNGADGDVMALKRFSAPADPDEFAVTVSGLRLVIASALKRLRQPRAA